MRIDNNLYSIFHNILFFFISLCYFIFHMVIHCGMTMRLHYFYVMFLSHQLGNVSTQIMWHSIEFLIVFQIRIDNNLFCILWHFIPFHSLCYFIFHMVLCNKMTMKFHCFYVMFWSHHCVTLHYFCNKFLNENCQQFIFYVLWHFIPFYSICHAYECLFQEGCPWDVLSTCKMSQIRHLW